MKVVRRSDGLKLEAFISEVVATDYKLVVDSRQYLFDWRLERFSDVYKLTLASDSEQLLGMMSLDDYPEQERLNINQLEVNRANRGRNKLVDGVAGCLIAYAARRSFSLGYGGMVTLESKYKLIEHYQTAYGFIDAGHVMVIYGPQSSKLISKYLEDE